MAVYPRERLVEHALKLLVRIEVDAPDQARQAHDALHAWRRRLPEHEAAAMEAQQRWAMLGGMAGELRERFEIPPQDARKQPSRPRRALLSLLVAGGGALLVGRGYWYWRQPLALASYSTHTAQLLTVRLPDAAAPMAATRLSLGPHTAIRTELYRDRRIVRLEHGEIHCDVARDADRPFQVVTRAGVVEVIGTAFSVSDRGGQVSIAVERGHVRFLPDESTSSFSFSPIDLLRGDALTILQSRPVVRHGIDAASVGAWRDGWLVFDNVPLAEALLAINAYRTRPIVAGDPRITAMRLTGRFRALDSAALLAALPVILPLRTRRQGDGSVELLSR